MTWYTGIARADFESGYHAGLAGAVARLAEQRARAARPAGFADAVEAAAWIAGYREGEAARDKPKAET